MPPATPQRAEPAPVVTQPAPVTPPTAEPAPVQPAPEVGVTPLPLPAVPAQAPFIGLLLPLDSPDFRAPADAFVRGFEAASLQYPTRLNIEVHATDASPERIQQTYADLLQQGAVVIVGPMTRSGVSAVATSGLVKVPTLTLNQPATPVALPPGLHTFGLSVEDEARYVAQRAYTDGVRRIGIVGTPSPLSRRAREAFIAAWRQLGGSEPAVMLEAQPPSDMTQMRTMLVERALEGVFLAAQYQDARMIRPYLPTQVPVYATSHVNVFPPDPVGAVDLNGVRFVDMPWLLQVDHPSVATFPRPADLSGDALRFYALGVDAYRIAMQLAEGRRSIELDGLTGRITMHPDGSIERRPWPAMVQVGEATPPPAPVPTE